VESLRQAVSVGGDAAANLGWLLKLGEQTLADSGAKPDRRPPRPARRAAVVERIVARDPSVAEALATRTGPLSPQEMETLRAARRALLRLAAQHPSYADLHFGLSLVAEQLGELDRAIEAAERAIAINPRYAEACLLAVRLYERRGRKDIAAEHCRRTTELRPNWLDAHLNLGRLMHEQGRPAEAIDSYRKALVIDGRCEEARQRLVVLEAAVAGPPPGPAAGEGGGQ
jgi:tetratricopeptide (TPR) repeat protein